MTLTDAMALGLLQGLTEFLPVSSSGHLAIAQHWLAGFEQPGILFDVMLHLGTLGAVLVYFWRDIQRLLTSPWDRSPAGAASRRQLGLIVIGSVPTAAIGLGFKDFFEGMYHNMLLVGAMLLITGALLFAAERWRPGQRELSDLTRFDALFTGLVQGLAVAPGISRSGSTISALLFRGVTPDSAARFSFLLSLPAIGGAALLSLRDFQHLATDQIPLYLAGSGVAFFSGLLAIHFLLGILRRRRLAFFALYCWAVASLLFVLS
ncbi:MAG: undecaprenyl-diphosphate phosphatase [Desulfuromonadaceae bacterium]|nr:undecaprenyl-diphosphate phosphatase [Desulfuromonadaceae bacterium]